MYENLSHNLNNIFISIYGDIHSEENKAIIKNSKKIKYKFSLKAEMYYFKADSVTIWR